MDTLKKIAFVACLVVGYGGLIWFVCRLISTNHLEDDEQ